MNAYKRQRFSPDIISHAVWLCYRLNSNHRDSLVNQLSQVDVPYQVRFQPVPGDKMEMAYRISTDRVTIGHPLRLHF